MTRIIALLDNTDSAGCIGSLLGVGNALQCRTHFHTQTIFKVIVLVLVLLTDDVQIRYAAVECA